MNGKANIQTNELNERFNLTYPQHSNQGYISQHLYITSDEEIKDSPNTPEDEVLESALDWINR